MSSNYPADPYHRGSAFSRSFLPLALITLGVVFLLGNLVPEHGRGGLVILGLAIAFLIGRVTTGRYGYAVPAGILLALAAYIGLQEVQTFQPVRGGGPFFVLLGLGFALVYVIGFRPAAVWPLFPAAVLIGLGLVLFGVASLGVLVSLTWIVGYWPIVLVVLGVWLLFRDHLPVRTRRPLATLGGLALLGYGILAAAASMATAGTMARSGLIASFSPTPLADSVTLDTPLAPGQTLSVDNSAGHTTIHASTTATTVHVVASRHFSFENLAPDVRLTPTADGASLAASSTGGRFPFGGAFATAVDYTIDMPAAARVKAQSSGGQIEIDGVGRDVQVDSNSGQLNLSNLGGSAQAHTSSGSIELNNVAGEVRAVTRSGEIHGTRLRHLREATTSSGSVSLEGTFAEAAQVRTSSGSVDLKLLPGTAVKLEVKTGSGSVQPEGGLQLTGGETRRDHLSGAIGTPTDDALLSVETSSGSVVVSQ